jgi:8-hydroxy-5-deazaflavin:NADPH oxidoreductase
MGLAGDLGRRDILRAVGTILGFGSPLRAPSAAGDTKVKIGVFGSGDVGSNLGRVLANAGHPVMFSSRNLEHDKQLAAGLARTLGLARPPRRRLLQMCS